ncbi:MAG: polysaccharide deacetylase family protein [Lachnospiraceae bacterium]|nr:polysaccharide deacetylase family protein [Lachnospiraceae bacterium]
MCKVLTLLYHRVNNLKHDKHLLAVTPDNFYKQLMFLKEHYPIVRFEEDWNNLREDAVCITFDDGYMDNFTNALPILQELEIPATVFVATGNVDSSEEFWWDELERILLDRQRNYDSTFTLEDELFSCQWPTETFADREELYDTLHWLMHGKIAVSKRKAWMRQLQSWSKAGNMGRKQNQAMQTEKIEELPSLLTVGAHTVNHPSLKSLSKQDQEYEISQSIKDLETLLKRRITVFSYPFGTAEDFDKTTIDLCRKENICKVAANIPGLWTPRCSDYEIPRNIIRNWNIEEYIQKIEELWKMG